MSNTLWEMATYFLFYSFLGWVAEVAIVAIKDKRFRNRGFVNLPFCTMYGVMMTILIELWPHMSTHSWFKFIASFVVFVVIQAIAEFLTSKICHRMGEKYEDITPYNGKWLNLLVAVLFAMGLWAVTELIHPFIYFVVHWIPEIPLKIVCTLVGIGIILDFFITLYSMLRYSGNQKMSLFQQKEQLRQTNLNERIYNKIWKRLKDAYPNIENVPKVQSDVFAEGICLDKLIWVFIVSALLGDIIETLYCWSLGGVWMSRSSVLYGPFSIVWGIGAVVLTLVLSRFAHKQDRYIFLVGALIGGVYEYVCSLFTDYVLGSVFWDYSWMPFNIGGRTNLLYMAFWGILSVVWIKIIYPRMSGIIEKLPVLQGKLITWVLILFMICNALLSAMALVRYVERRSGIEASSVVDTFLDKAYEDSMIEKVWPNMMMK